MSGSIRSRLTGRAVKRARMVQRVRRVLAGPVRIHPCKTGTHRLHQYPRSSNSNITGNVSVRWTVFISPLSICASIRCRSQPADSSSRSARSNGFSVRIHPWLNAPLRSLEQALARRIVQVYRVFVWENKFDSPQRIGGSRPLHERIREIATRELGPVDRFWIDILAVAIFDIKRSRTEVIRIPLNAR